MAGLRREPDGVTRNLGAGIGGAFGVDLAVDSAIFTAKETNTEWLPGGQDDAAAQRRCFQAMTAGSGCVLAALRTGQLARWYPIEQEHVQVDFGKDRCCDISRVFLEPKGFHAIITSSSEESWYLNFQSSLARQLPKLKSHIVEAVAWDPDSTANSTKDLVIGTVGGQLLQLVVENGKEKTLKPLYVFEISGGGGAAQPISGAHRERTLAMDGSSRDVIFVAAGCGIYAFVGPTVETLFGKYQGANASLRALVYEVPRDSPHGEIMVDNACSGLSSSKVIFWLTGVGVLAATMHCPLPSDSDVLEDPPGLIPFPRRTKSMVGTGGLIQSLLPQTPQAPLSMALSRYHIIFLFEDRWAVVSRITHDVVQQQDWPKGTYGGLRCLARDSLGEQLWMCSEKYLFELVIEREDRDIWLFFLQLELFDEALAACKMDSQRNRVLAAHADWLFKKGRYVESARKFGEAITVPFEHVALRFARPDRKEALLEYLMCRLVGIRSDERVKRVLLAVWVVEISLARLNELSLGVVDADSRKGGAHADRIREEERTRLHRLLRDCADLEVHPTIYHLLQSHGWLQELTIFAEARLDYTTSILHYVSRRDFAGAVKKLGEFQAAIECEELVSRFAPILFSVEPNAFVSLLLKSQLESVVPLSVLPAICPSPWRSAVQRKEAIRYLEHTVIARPELGGLPTADADLSHGAMGNPSRGASSLQLRGDLMSGVVEDAAGGSVLFGRGPWTSGTALLNALVILHSHNCQADCVVSTKSTSVVDKDQSRSTSSQDVLLRFLAAHETNTLFDKHFALRVCRELALTRPCVQLYGSLGLHEEAVDLALRHGDIGMAKHNACKPSDRRLRQKLWLRVVESQASSGADAQTVVSIIAGLIRESQELTVRDVLPYMSDAITIGAFQTEICECLNAYEEQVLTSRQEMDDHRRALQAFKEDLRLAEERSVVIEEDHPCKICNSLAVAERFYAFPCGHCVHESCLRTLLLPVLKDADLSRLQKLEKQRLELTSAQTTAAGSISSFSSALAVASASTKEMEIIEDELDGIMAKDCPWCGELLIQTIRRPFIDTDEGAEIASWIVA